ncbi:hypothetical protein SO802_031242 [Lithocarpus litseifolius]|uniref:Non-specific lipid-transfer protein n=1 Tax=Lithocarpus litseifolius TaxID=425828 RepID=A0AAW2BLT1_9ROSI
MANLKLACVLFLCMIVVAAPIAQATITCTQVSKSLTPCLTYLKSNGGSPPPGTCCQGVRNLNGMAKTTPDRQAACKCLKTTASEIFGLNPTLAANLPKNCGVNVPYKISTSTDCSNSTAVDALRSTGASPPPANCCQGVRNLNGMANTTPDLQAACNCLKTAASEISGLNTTLVANLPKNCGVNIPYKISISTDCSNEDDRAAICGHRDISSVKNKDITSDLDGTPL